ncbi:S8 family peptidase [Marilutibacter alkalisoli]|uniref:S8 family serine peptidase n=1 Tax=Marilutibacter alkalisoli TaxID=2591633 RepID=A0A514BQZ5_9GAMM|nr:S8 family peptidase [Lysobacter alkalisoli]QDH69791.1 S8 family serine peptidase [Lysobacter alkalisoli]
MSRTFRRAALTGAVLVSLGLSSTAVAGGRLDLVMKGLNAGTPHVPGELLVKFRDGTSLDQQAALPGKLGAQKLETLSRGNGKQGELALLRLGGGRDFASTLVALNRHPAIEYAEPNWVYQHSATSNDPYYTNGSLWGMYGDATSPANQYGSRAGEAWAKGHTSCGDVWVGIIDEGYMYTHDDLAANAGVNPGEIPGNGIDDDGNGYVDDVYGWDFDGGDNSVFDGVDDDHGTHVAGTIGGVGGNGTGVAGVCWSVKLFGAKFLGKRGGTTANAVKAVDYMTDMKTRHGLNLVATNNSWGGGGFSQALQDAIERANQANILFIAAAGNSSYDCDSSQNCYPAEYPNSNIVAVASITSSGAMSSFSSYGANTVDICAPGSAIYSTVPRRQQGQVVSGYASYSGTSMATPHVAGAAALYKSSHPGASAADVKAGIMGSAVTTASCQGKVVSNGRLNVSGF